MLLELGGGRFYCRPMKRISFLLLTALLAVPAIAPAQDAATTRQYRYVMGTSVEVQASGGDHAKIARWRRGQREETTRERRPDLWARFLANSKAKGD